MGAIIASAENAGRDAKKAAAKTRVLQGERGEVKIGDGKKKNAKANGAGGASKKLRVYDRFLKEFRYGAALDAALKRVSPFSTNLPLLS